MNYIWFEDFSMKRHCTSFKALNDVQCLCAGFCPQGQKDMIKTEIIFDPKFYLGSLYQNSHQMVANNCLLSSSCGRQFETLKAGTSGRLAQPGED